MKRALKYAVEEALASLWRGWRAALLATATIAAALVVLGGFLVVTTNLEQMLDAWGASAELSVYLKDSTSPEERTSLQNLLRASEIVTDVRFVSKAEALERFEETFNDLAGATDGLGENPFPASLEARLRPSGAGDSALEQLAQRVSQSAGVADVRYDRQWIERLLTAVAILRGSGLLLAGVMILAAALTVANVVRLALYARREEIRIMQLVGAPYLYIRAPFVVEGLLQGGVGALLALGVLALGVGVVQSQYGEALSVLIGESAFRFLPPGRVLLLLAGGMTLGSLGGLLAGLSVRDADAASDR